MNKSMIAGTVLGVVVATAGVAFAGYKMTAHDEYAQVVDVSPVSKTTQIPHEKCVDEQVTHTKEIQDEHRIAGTALGAVIGGVVGHQIGGGKGQDLATIAGAVGGGYAGNKVQQRNQANNTYTTVEQRCHTETSSETKVTGYEVKYKLDGKISTVHMDHEPGERIPVQDGLLQLDQ